MKVQVRYGGHWREVTVQARGMAGGVASYRVSAPEDVAKFDAVNTVVSCKIPVVDLPDEGHEELIDAGLRSLAINKAFSDAEYTSSEASEVHQDDASLYFRGRGQCRALTAAADALAIIAEATLLSLDIGMAGLCASMPDLAPQVVATVARRFVADGVVVLAEDPAPASHRSGESHAYRLVEGAAAIFYGASVARLARHGEFSVRR